MDRSRRRGVRGWLLVYLVGSIPLLMVYSIGLSGWVFDYPIGFMMVMFLVFAVPLALILLQFPSAPQWNIVILRTTAVLMTLRSISVSLMSGSNEQMSSADWNLVAPTLVGLISTAVGWATAWTLMYFRHSERVHNTFVRETLPPPAGQR